MSTFTKSIKAEAKRQREAEKPGSARKARERAANAPSKAFTKAQRADTKLQSALAKSESAEADAIEFLVTGSGPEAEQARKAIATLTDPKITPTVKLRNRAMLLKAAQSGLGLVQASLHGEDLQTPADIPQVGSTGSIRGANQPVTDKYTVAKAAGFDEVESADPAFLAKQALENHAEFERLVKAIVQGDEVTKSEFSAVQIERTSAMIRAAIGSAIGDNPISRAGANGAAGGISGAGGNISTQTFSPDTAGTRSGGGLLPQAAETWAQLNALAPTGHDATTGLATGSGGGAASRLGAQGKIEPEPGVHVTSPGFDNPGRPGELPGGCEEELQKAQAAYDAATGFAKERAGEDLTRLKLRLLHEGRGEVHPPAGCGM